MSLLAASNPQALWYLTRGFGLADLVLLSLSVVLGVSQVNRFTSAGRPRFFYAGLHKSASLMALLLLVVHVASAVADPFAPISLVDAVVPFVGVYRPIWLGLGALAGDLLLALALTSLVRDRIGYRAWRSLHWAAYACWPVALVHGLGTGSDSRIGWVQVLYAVCALAVALAVGWRLTSRFAPVPSSRRLALASLGTVVAVVVVVWAATGPARPGWAKRSGTPSYLLGTSKSGHQGGSG